MIVIMKKNRYLALYDYGSGGVWIFVHAKSADDITQKYPELLIMDERKHQSDLYPASMTDLEKMLLDKSLTYDIDDTPRGFCSRL